MATKYDALYNRDEVKSSIIGYYTIINQVPRWLKYAGIEDVPEDIDAVIDDHIDKFIDIYHKHNTHRVTRKEFISALSAYRQMAINFGDEEMLAITNKLIGDRKIFDKVLMIVDGSYVQSRIWVSLGRECFNMQLDDGVYKDRTAKQIKKSIGKLYRENDHIFCQFYIGWTYDELMDEWQWQDEMEKAESSMFDRMEDYA